MKTETNNQKKTIVKKRKDGIPLRGGTRIGNELMRIFLLMRVLFVTVGSAMPLLEAVKVLVSIMMSVSVSNKRETIEVETLRHQQSTFPRKSPETHLHQTSRRGSSEVWRRQSWQIGQEHVRNSRCFQHLAA